MAKKRQTSKELKIERPKPANLSAQETLNRMQDFSKQKVQFIAAIRRVAH
jgi:hypothetical protein